MKKKRKEWWEKHHEDCMAFRAKFGVKEGDGIKRLAKMKQGPLIERTLAKNLEKWAHEGFWSMDFFDAYVAAMPQFKEEPPD